MLCMELCTEDDIQEYDVRKMHMMSRRRRCTEAAVQRTCVQTKCYSLGVADFLFFT